MKGRISKWLFIIVLIVIIGLWALSGVYTVESAGGEQAIVTRFGKHVNTVTEAGLHWHIPSPIEKIEKVKVDEVRTIEIGFRTLRGSSEKQAGQYQELPEQSLMLTGDENMVNVETVIQYIISDASKYLFNVYDQQATMLDASESSVRRVVANHVLDEVLTDNKSSIQEEIKSDLQLICDKYDNGVYITNVQFQDIEPPVAVDDAFKDVSNAREDKTSYINEAESYKNEIIPKARGNAAELLNQAEAYKQKRIAEAKGDVANFVQVLEKYQQGKEVTRTRMYLETLEEILPGIEKYIVDGDGNTLNFLPLDGNSFTDTSSQ